MDVDFNDGLLPASDHQPSSPGGTHIKNEWGNDLENWDDDDDDDDASEHYDGTSSSSSCDSSSADEWGESVEKRYGQPPAAALATYKQWLATQSLVEKLRIDQNSDNRSEIRKARDLRRRVKFAVRYTQQGGDRRRAEHEASSKLRRYHRDDRGKRAKRKSGEADEATKRRRAARRAERRKERRRLDYYLDDEGNWKTRTDHKKKDDRRNKTRDDRRAKTAPSGGHHQRTIDPPLFQPDPQPQVPQQGQYGYPPLNPPQPQFGQPTQQHGVIQHETPPYQVSGGLAFGAQLPNAPPEQGSKRKWDSSHNSSEDAEGEVDSGNEAREAKRQQTSQPGVTTAAPTLPAFPTQAPFASQHGNTVSATEWANATHAGGLGLLTTLTEGQLQGLNAEINELLGDPEPDEEDTMALLTEGLFPDHQQTDYGFDAASEEASEEAHSTGSDPIQPPQSQGQGGQTYNTPGQTVNPQDLTFQNQLDLGQAGPPAFNPSGPAGPSPLPPQNQLNPGQARLPAFNPSFPAASDPLPPQNQQNPGRAGPPALNPSGLAAPDPLPPQQAADPQPPQPTGGEGAGGGAGDGNQPAPGGGGGQGNTGQQGGQGGRGRGAVNAQGAKRTHKQRKAITLGEGAGGWKDHAATLHPRTLGAYNQAQQQGALVQNTEMVQFENRQIKKLDENQETYDKAICATSGRAAKRQDKITAPTPLLRLSYPITQETEPCKRCVDEQLECNIRQTGGKECDNCTRYRYDTANWPQSIDHECLFEEERGQPLVPAERKASPNEIINFLRPDLWQCDWCAQEGRYCDGDRLMSVKCTTCQSEKRACTFRGSEQLRERDYLRAYERSFRIMCRLCCKAGKRCSWADSTANYGTGKPCMGCEQLDKNDKQRAGACTTFSRLPPFAASGIWNPLPLANVLPAVRQTGDLFFIKQRRPWRSQIDMLDDAKVRHQGNGMKQVFHDDDPGRANRRSCEFCYYTASECHFLGSDTESACKTCTYIGIKCMARGGRKIGDVPNVRVPWPPYNLANATGYLARRGEWVHYYTHCKQCTEAKRHCDRKRPCEGCRKRNLVCEPPTWGKGVFVADRHAGDRSGNYYMALGHGPEGLGAEMVMRDPTRIACGPKKPLGHWLAPRENAQKEAIRAQRCKTREANLRQLEPGYQPPGSGWFPPSFAVDQGYEDPTEPPGWPGSYIRNDREPIGSRKAPEYEVHPPGIANYQPDDAPGIGEGGPPPAGGEVQPPPVHHEPVGMPPAHHEPAGMAPTHHGYEGIGHELSPLAHALGYNVNLPGYTHNQTGEYQEAPAHGAGGQVNYPTIGGGDVFMGAQNPLPGDYNPGLQGYQPQPQGGVGGQVNDLLPAAGQTQLGPGFTLNDDLYSSDEVHQGYQPHALDPPFQEHQGQALPADEDQVLFDAITQALGDDTEQDDAPPEMNPFVPLQEPTSVPPNTNTGGVSNELLKPFRLGEMFKGVERFLSWKDEASPLVEDEAVTAPAPSARNHQPDTAFQWAKPPAFGKVTGDDRTQAVMRIHKPGNNVLRDVPDGPPMEIQNDEWACKDYRAPEGDKCEEADRHGRCENMRHAQSGSKVFPVCADCDMASKTHLWTADEGGAGLTDREILNMRAYFCADCSNAAQNPEAWEGRGFDVYGFSAEATRDVDVSKEVTVDGVVDRQGGWRDEKALPITGCNCARKLMGRVLCSYHRLFLAQKMARQAALMQEWRFRRYKEEKVCPMCLDQPGLDSSKAEQVDGPRFWNCLVCNGMVAASERERRDKRSIEVGKVVEEEWYRWQVPQELRDIGDHDYQINQWEEHFSTAETVEESEEETGDEETGEDEGEEGEEGQEGDI